jgi:hypothetical protein
LYSSKEAVVSTSLGLFSLVGGVFMSTLGL